MSEEAAKVHQVTTAEALALMRTAAVGRIAVVLDGRPEIFPVNHVVDHGAVIFRTAVGSKLEGAKGQPVAFEVDGYDAAVGQAWSVVVKGTAEEIRDRDEVLAAMELPLFPWMSGNKPRFVRIPADEVTALRFTVPEGYRGSHES